MMGVYSNMYYPTRWVPLKRRGLGWQRCNDLYEEHRCIASCGLIDSELEIVLDMKGCNLNCKYCWGWKMRYLSDDIVKSPEDVVRDVACRVKEVMEDRLVRRSRYRFGVIRITGNEPTLQWRHLMEVLKILDDLERLRELCPSEEVAEVVHRCKVIVETNGVAVGMGKVDFSDVEVVENIQVDFDVSFKGVNEEQFEWLSDRPRRYFEYQIEGFVKMFDLSESLENVNVNPVLGINHAPNYRVWRGGKSYTVDVEIVDRRGRKMDFEDFSKRFEEEVLSRKDLRFDEAPFREYFGINKERTRMVIAVVYRGIRYLHVLPSEVIEISQSRTHH